MKFTVYEQFRYELFEQLLPAMLFDGTDEERWKTLELLVYDGENMAHNCFADLCEMDGVDYPYDDNDFKAENFVRGGVHFVKISLPEIENSKGINDVLRAYVLYSKVDDRIDTYKYFVIKKFASENRISILNIDSKKALLGHELTEHSGDMDYEYWALANNYATLLLKDFEEEKSEFDTKRV